MAGMEQNGGGNRTYGKNVGLFNYLIQLFYQLSTVYSRDMAKTCWAMLLQ